MRNIFVERQAPLRPPAHQAQAQQMRGIVGMVSIYMLFLSTLFFTSSHGFQLSMVMDLPARRRIPSTTTTTSTSTTAHGSPFSVLKRQSSPTTTTTRSPSKSSSYVTDSSGTGVTSTLISTLAIAALKRRMMVGNDSSSSSTEASPIVCCDVSGSSSDLLLRGIVGPVTVKGRRWRSPLGLTCRVLEATVNQCQLDIGAILSRQKLVLTTPAKGNAMIALNAMDFGNFITHPLMDPPTIRRRINNNNNNDDSQTMKDFQVHFEKDNIIVDPSTGTVQFYGTCGGRRWNFTLGRRRQLHQHQRTSIPNKDDRRATVQVSLAEQNENIDNNIDNNSINNIDDENMNTELAQELTNVISSYFNDLVFVLDGTFLSFQDMMVTSKCGGGTLPCVMLSLDITVKKFPSAGLKF